MLEHLQHGLARNSSSVLGRDLPSQLSHWYVDEICTLQAVETNAPQYIGEIAPPQIRGTLLCMYGFSFAIGQLLASVVLYVISNARPLDWLVPVYTEWAIHGLWIFFGFIWLPESPWYYARRGRDEKALKALGRIYRGVAGFDSNHELTAIKHELERQREAESVVSAWTDLFKGTNRIRTLAAGLAIATQMFAGAIIVFTYTTYFIQQAGIGEPFLATMIVTIVLLVGLITSFFAVELAGRRTLIIGGGVFCTICNLIIGITGCFPKTKALNNTALAFIFIWVFSYAGSFAGVSWALVSECATPRLKSKTAAFATLCYDTSSLVFTVSVPYMLATSGPGARGWGTKSIFMFAITMATATIGNFFLCPEVSLAHTELQLYANRSFRPRTGLKVNLTRCTSSGSLPATSLNMFLRWNRLVVSKRPSTTHMACPGWRSRSGGNLIESVLPIHPQRLVRSQSSIFPSRRARRIVSSQPLAS